MLLTIAVLCALSGNVIAIPLDEYEKNLTAHIKNFATANSPSPAMYNKSVYCIVDLYQIISVEEKNNVLNAKIWLYCYYVIVEMAWNPADHGNITTLIFKKDTFWTPDIELDSMTENQYQSSTSQYVNYEGTILPTATSINAKLSCKFDVTDFPHDQHTCVLQLRQWIYNMEEYRVDYPVQITNGKYEMPLAYYVSHDQWHLIRPVVMEAGSTTFGGRQYDHQSYKIQIQRSPDFFLRVLVYPTLIIYVISTLSFYLPFESGEKVSLSITILLAQVVNLLVLSDSIPASSINFPVFGKFVLVNIVFVGITVLVSVITLNMYHKNCSTLPPYFLRKMLYTRIAWLFGATKLPGSCNAVHDIKKVQSNSKNSASQSKELFDKVVQIEEMSCSAEMEEKVKLEWQLIALVIDRCCGCIYIVLGIVVFFVYNPLHF